MAGLEGYATAVTTGGSTGVHASPSGPGREYVPVTISAADLQTRAGTKWAKNKPH